MWKFTRSSRPKFDGGRNLTDPLTAAATAAELARAVSKVPKFFEPFRPSIRGLNLDYKDCEAELKVLINVAGHRRGKKVIIPTNEQFEIVEMVDSAFNRIERLWKRTDKGLVLKAKDLPHNSDLFLVTLRGPIPRESVRGLVDIHVPATPYVDSELDKYWLATAIRDPEILKIMYQDLQIRGVDLTVNVTVQRCFSTSIPHKMRAVMIASRDLIRASQTGNRELKRKAEHRLRMVSKYIRVTDSEIAVAITSLVSEELFRDYIRATNPYSLSGISPDGATLSPIPKRMNVSVSTNLSYQLKTANGELIFDREKYKDEIGKRLSRLER